MEKPVLNPPVIVWFRLDLRLSDNPALHAAVSTGRPVLPVFLWAPEEEGAWPPGAASRWWLHQSLKALQGELRALGSRLVLRVGPSADALETLARETGAAAVYWNRRYEPAVRARDGAVRSRLQSQGLDVFEHEGSLLYPPETLLNRAGLPYQVFTPFWRRCQSLLEPVQPLAAPVVLPKVPCSVQSVELRDFSLEPSFDWAAGLRDAWQPGEANALRRLDGFLESELSQYPVARDLPAQAGTSRLSPYLHFGEISPRQILWKIQQTMDEHRHRSAAAAESFIRELVWREFAWHLLYHFPGTADRPLRERFTTFPWRTDDEDYRRWCSGRTGFPLVDAGMRELWTTGWMHNRVRMVAASFLVKDLLISWREGARWFWDTLVDADLANNTLGWQWVAGCGADAAPYFRIFNPMSQSRKFDAEGEYLKRWIPALSHLPGRHTHEPHKHGITADQYPAPMVEHARARKMALNAFGSM